MRRKLFEGARPRAPEWLSLLIDRIPRGGRILDVGCGSGIPLTQSLAGSGLAVVGIDISLGQISRALDNVHGATFIHGDVMRQDFAVQSFDAIVAIYTLFHLPRDEHAGLIQRMHRWLRPGGALVMTLASTANVGYVEDDFNGAPMYWSHFSEPEYLQMLAAESFAGILRLETGHGYASTNTPAEQHPPVIAEKRSPGS